jgi:hypothetical protein
MRAPIPKPTAKYATFAAMSFSIGYLLFQLATVQIPFLAATRSTSCHWLGAHGVARTLLSNVPQATSV